jgi:hypothetical protein
VQLIKKGSVEGVWFTFEQKDAQADEKPARFLVRRVPTAFDRERFTHHFGYKAEIRRKSGTLISDLEPLKRMAYTLDLACYALIESENAEVPSELVPGRPANEAGMVLLDGKWTDDLKRIVLGEVPSLATWIMEQANSLTAQAIDEEDAKTKNS